MTAAHDAYYARFEERNDEILALSRDRWTNVAIARFYNISPARVAQIIARDEQKRRFAVAQLLWAIHPDELRGKRAVLLGRLLVRVAMGHALDPNRERG